jgi:hypothetical protein
MISLTKSIVRTQERWVEEGGRREPDVRRENTRESQDPKERTKKEAGSQEEDKYIVTILFPNLIYIIYF